MTAEVSIIIVNWRVRELLRACLASLRGAAGGAPGRMQIIVVDNASGDGSVDMVEHDFPDVTLLANDHNPGFGRANNQALPLCSAPFILLLNPDTLVPDGAVQRMLDHMYAAADVAALGCRLTNADGSLQRWTGGAFPTIGNLANHYLFLDRLLPRGWRGPPLYLDRDVQQDIEVDWVSGACMMLRASALLGRLFDPAFFMYGEDMELCHRLKGAGHRVIYSPAASIVHYQGASMQQQRGEVLLSSLKGPRQFFRQTRGDGALVLFDLLTMAGFGLRYLLYTAAAWIRPRRGLAARATSSRDLLRRAWRIRRD